MIHTLKIENNYLENLLLGRKTCEVRFNDRDYQVGDILEFHDLHGISKENPYGSFRFEITHIHSGLGLKELYVVLSVKKMEGKDE